MSNTKRSILLSVLSIVSSHSAAVSAQGVILHRGSNPCNLGVCSKVYFREGKPIDPPQLVRRLLGLRDLLTIPTTLAPGVGAIHARGFQRR